MLLSVYEFSFLKQKMKMWKLVWLPSEEFGDGVGAENGGGVAVGDAGDVGENVLVGDDGQGFLETIAIGVAVEAVPREVLHVGVSGEDFGEDLLLDLVRVGGYVLDEVQLLLVVLGNAEAGHHRVLIGCLRHGMYVLM